MRANSQTEPDVTPAEPSDRRTRTRARIFDAVVRCLDEVGYSETSINRVQTLAGVSRGALTHHFPSKEAMMVQTLERLLAPVRGPSGPGDDAGLIRPAGEGRDVATELTRLWAGVINTRQGRALMEILVASRTDETLRARITPALQDYNDTFNRNIAHLYDAVSGDADDLALLWSICRSFMRGLHSQAPYERDPEVMTRLVDRFAEIMAPHMRAKQEPK